jgi:hypothetical protein
VGGMSFLVNMRAPTAVTLTLYVTCERRPSFEDWVGPLLNHRIGCHARLTVRAWAGAPWGKEGSVAVKSMLVSIEKLREVTCSSGATSSRSVQPTPHGVHQVIAKSIPAIHQERRFSICTSDVFPILQGIHTQRLIIL